MDNNNNNSHHHHHDKTKPKKRKHAKEGADELNAQVFKKALITPTANAVVSSSSSLPAQPTSESSALFAQLDMMGGMDSGEASSDSSDEEDTKVAPVTVGRKMLPSTSPSLSSASVLPNALENAANVAAVATMADFLSNAGSSAPRPDLQIVSAGATLDQGVIGNEQAMVTAQDEASTRLTRDQILASIAGIPAMQMLLQSDLMSLSNDPSVLATLDNNTSSAPVMITETTEQQGEDSIKKKDKKSKKDKKDKEDKDKKKSKDKEPKKRKDIAENEEVGSNSSKSKKNKVISLEDQLDADLARISDNPLHTKWMMANELKEKGITYKMGTFSTLEDNVIRQTIREYFTRIGREESAMTRWFENNSGKGREEKNELKPLWVEIAARLESRPLLNIYLHIRRMYHPQNNVGQWTKEDDTKLIELHAKHKGQWTKIGNELGRMADSCRDRYRNHLKDQDTMVSGPWAPHEDELLLDIMQELAEQQGKATILESSHLWTTIAEKMNGKRSRHQCRHRFSQALMPRLERGEFIRTKAGAALAAATAAKALKQQKQAALPESSSSSSALLNTIHDSVSAVDDEFRTLAAALQSALPSTASENLLWSQALTTNTDLGATATGNHHQNTVDHETLTAAIAAVAGLPVALGTYQLQGAPLCRKGRPQLMLDHLHWIQDHKVKDHLDVKWNDASKELKAQWQECHKIELDKIAKTQEQLQLQAQQFLQNGHESSLAATAAAAAMTRAAADTQTESMKILHIQPSGHQTSRTFMMQRCKIEGYREMGLQAVVSAMMEDLEKKVEERDRGMYATAVAHAEKSGGAIDPASVVKKVTPKSLGPIHQQHLIEFVQFAVLEALWTQFPQLQQLRLRRQQQQQHRGDATGDEDESMLPLDNAEKAVIKQQQQTRSLAEKMISEAMIQQGLPLFAAKNQRRLKSQELYKTKEFISDSESNESGDEEDA
ncbi:RNA polymerase I enhancer binding protein [Mortierella claussenii]|nr:RNA polymerase I enhancer binding protein [Mortierella claussenii]